jgi:hypothetical protein
MLSKAAIGINRLKELSLLRKGPGLVEGKTQKYSTCHNKNSLSFVE